MFPADADGRLRTRWVLSSGGGPATAVARKRTVDLHVVLDANEAHKFHPHARHHFFNHYLRSGAYNSHPKVAPVRRRGARATTHRRVRGTSLTTHRSCAPTATSSGATACVCHGIHNTGTRCNVLFDDTRLPSPGATHRALPPLPLADASTYNSCVDGPRPRGERTSACNVGGDGAPRGVGGGARVQW